MSNNITTLRLLIGFTILSAHHISLAFIPIQLPSFFSIKRQGILPNQKIELKLSAQNLTTGTTTATSPTQKTLTVKNKSRLSRSERKALERDAKGKSRSTPEQQQQQQQQAPRKTRQSYRTRVIHRPTPPSEPYSLHSTTLPRLTPNSTADDVMRAIKRAQNIHDEHDMEHIKTFLLQEVDESFAYGYRGSLLARLAVAACHMNNHELAREALVVRRVEHRSSMMPLESAAIIRGLLRMHNVSDAMDVLDDELSLPLPGTDLTSMESRERIRHRALALGSIASRHFYEGEPEMAVMACGMLAELGPVVRECGLTAKDVNMPWARIVKGAGQCEAGRRDGSVDVNCDDVCDLEMPCNLVYAVLNAMTTFPPQNDDKVYEAVSNALVRRCIFITGAIDMTKCPKMDRGEVAFIGRSNVGKSSLVNMITNRKSLAYTSKRPGKTQQFNFFAVNDKPGREREIKYGDTVDTLPDRDSFYIVDLPGFGFAKVPQKQRQEWSAFMTEYITKRKTLKVLFHLIDARHGPIDDDMRIMKQVGESLPSKVIYVVVLTKADKNVKNVKKMQGRVSKDVMTQLRGVMKQNRVGNSPVILTSAETKLGRDDLWRYMKLAAEG